jgi:outer membrane protein TolC
VVLGIFAGCAVGPDYVPPQISVPQAWHAELSGGATAEEMDPQALANWWTTFDDPTLTSLIERAVRNNVDLKKARARVGEARASRGVSRASLFPTLGFTVSATRSHSSQNAMGDT